MPELTPQQEQMEKLEMLSIDQKKAEANLKAARIPSQKSESPADRSDDVLKKEGYITTSDEGGVFVFGEPLGVDAVDLGTGQKIFVEIDEKDSEETLQAIEDVIRSDMRNGKTWDDFGGLAVNPHVLRHLVNLGIVTEEQVLNSVPDPNRQKLTTHFSASRFYPIFSGGLEKLVPDDHDFYRAKLIIMTSEEIEKTYGERYRLVTIDRDENSL